MSCAVRKSNFINYLFLFHSQISIKDNSIINNKIKEQRDPTEYMNGWINETYECPKDQSFQLTNNNNFICPIL